MNIYSKMSEELIENIKRDLDKLSKILNDKRSVDEGEKSFYCDGKDANGNRRHCSIQCAYCAGATK